MKGLPGFLAWFGLKCSSLVGINKGTSGRTACHAVGYVQHPSVSSSNTLIERTPNVCFELFHFQKNQPLSHYDYDSTPNPHLPIKLFQDHLLADAGASLRWNLDCRAARVKRPTVLPSLGSNDDLFLRLVWAPGSFDKDLAACSKNVFLEAF